MNSNENNTGTDNSGAEDAKAPGKIDAAAALASTGDPTPEAPKSLYAQWQDDYAATLMDGTYSEQSYTLLKAADGIQYGVQLRLLPCHKHLHLQGRIRVAGIQRAVQSGAEKMAVPSAEEVAAKIAAYKDFVVGDQSWSQEDDRRISRVFSITIPVNPKEEGALEQFVGFVPALIEKLLDFMPQPVVGYDSTDRRRIAGQLTDYFKATINQFGIFNVITITEKKWTDDTVAAGEPSEPLVQLLQTLEPLTEVGKSDEATGAAGSGDQSEPDAKQD